MPEAICDTSPLQYLHHLKLLELLPTFYQRVTIHRAVVDELAAGIAARIDLPDVTTLKWLEISNAAVDAALHAEDSLGAGERGAISLAAANPNSILLIDDGLARQFASKRGLRYTGTLGVLVRGKTEGLIPFVRPKVEALRWTGFRMSA